MRLSCSCCCCCLNSMNPFPPEGIFTFVMYTVPWHIIVASILVVYSCLFILASLVQRLEIVLSANVAFTSPCKAKDAGRRGRSPRVLVSLSRDSISRRMEFESFPSSSMQPTRLITIEEKSHRHRHDDQRVRMPICLHLQAFGRLSTKSSWHHRIS